ncbi:MAG: Flp pilus assembly complex ATPase component TadA, partial [Proteobacteria bacterium]|nr:Flp pilus assembly complex ATPase component TadA [Pseudomonadota bacterium]
MPDTKKKKRREGGGSKKIGNILLESGYITEDQLATAVSEHLKTGNRLGETLIENGYITETDMARTLSVQLGIPYTDFDTTVVDPAAIELVSEKLAVKHRALPVSIERGVLTVAMADPLDFLAIQDLGFVTGRSVEPTVAVGTEIKKAIQRHYHMSEPVHEILNQITDGHVEVVPDAVDVTQSVESAVRKGTAPPIIKIVNTIIFNAVKHRASDIHIEPRAKNVVVRVRIDGMLHDTMELPKWVQGAVTSRIKVLAMLDISEKRIPQDGRIRIRIEDREIDLRISVLPIQYGESIVIRVLDLQNDLLGLAQLGLSSKDYQRIRSIVEKPQGIVLVTGPTGSGKTFSLYATIKHIKSDVINIISLEEPIEYELAGVKQVAVNEKTGLSFSFGLRSILRQDPDVIMIGEMRDLETSNIAVQSSLTGHLVLSTLHTNTAVAAITRLKNLGIPTYLIASSLNGIVAQRLLRKLCDKCKKVYKPGADELKQLGLKSDEAAKIKFYRGVGCKSCSKTGYKGRIGVFEVLVCTPAVREAITSDAPEADILRAAQQGGMRLMSQDGLEKTSAGLTSIEEVLRVLYVEEAEEVHLCRACAA